MTYTTNDEIKDLIINTMPRAVFEDLSAKGQIDGDQIYFIEDEGAVDVNGESITNLKEPVLSSDAATKNYVDEEIKKIDVTEQLTSYYTKEQTNNLSTIFREGLATIETAKFLSDSIDELQLDNVFVANGKNAEFIPSSISVNYISKQDYIDKIQNNSIDPNILYIVQGFNSLDGFGQTIQNVSTPILSDDAATKNYVDEEIKKIDITDQIADFYKKNETSSSSELQEKLSSYTTSSDVSSIIEKYNNSKVIINGVKSDLSIRNISDEEYYSLSESERAISNLLYVVSSENENFFGQRLQNIADPTISSDAATKNYVDNQISNQLSDYQIKGDYLSSSTERTTSADVSAIVEGYTSRIITIRKWSN